ncbi:Cthe_2314 family HEPN domain-containing protein [Fusibacter bizertensis]
MISEEIKSEEIKSEEIKSEEVLLEDMRSKEMLYLNALMMDIEKELGNISIPFSEGKIVYGASGPGLIGKYFSCKMIIDSTISVNDKILYSFSNALINIYSDEVLDDFAMFSKGGEKEFLAFYYLENIIYRTSMIWDYTAQLYNLFYELGEDLDKIHYKSFFNNCGQSKKFKHNPSIQKINSYFKESDDISSDVAKWSGNHNYVKELRNEMTHRSAFDVTALSPVSIKMKPHPAYVLKRVLEDYNSGISFFKEIALEVAKLKKDII